MTNSIVSAYFSSLAEFLTVRAPVLGVFVAFVGLWKIVRVTSTFLKILIETAVPRGPRLAPYKVSKQTGANWAIVTGSTAGIGEQFAHQLAAAGFNILLVSRSEAKLQKVAQEIGAKNPKIQTASFVLDAATATTANYGELKAFVEKLGNVSVLINNLGISHEMPTPFVEVPDSALHEIVQVNCIATMEITRAVLPTLQAYTSTPGSRRALILTMGSMAGLTPTPLLSVYTGSKMFLQGWSSALAEELQASNIDVQLIVSYLVTSAMSKVKRTSLLCPNPASFVKSTLRSIGYNGGAQERAYTMTPYWSHALFHWAIESSLGVWSKTVSVINFRMHLDIRKRALRKLAKSK